MKAESITKQARVFDGVDSFLFFLYFLCGLDVLSLVFIILCECYVLFFCQEFLFQIFLLFFLLCLDVNSNVSTF